MKTENDVEQLKDVIVLAGQILLESGANGYRIESTMNTIAHHFGYVSCNSFVTNTVINFSLHDLTYPRVKRVTVRDTNLIKISKVNELSRQITNGDLSVEKALQQLNEIQQSTMSYPLLFKSFASGIIGLSFLFLQGGVWQDAATAVIAAALGFVVKERVAHKIPSFFIPEFIASVLIALIVVGAGYFSADNKVSIAIIAAVMPIVPGVLITNSLQDLLAGNMLLALTKGMEAAVTAFAIGTGVATVLYVF